jgi:hypothetical protein
MDGQPGNQLFLSVFSVEYLTISSAENLWEVNIEELYYLLSKITF